MPLSANRRLAGRVERTAGAVPPRLVGAWLLGERAVGLGKAESGPAGRGPAVVAEEGPRGGGGHIGEQAAEREDEGHHLRDGQGQGGQAEAGQAGAPPHGVVRAAQPGTDPGGAPPRLLHRTEEQAGPPPVPTKAERAARESQQDQPGPEPLAFEHGPEAGADEARRQRRNQAAAERGEGQPQPVARVGGILAECLQPGREGGPPRRAEQLVAVFVPAVRPRSGRGGQRRVGRRDVHATPGSRYPSPHIRAAAHHDHEHRKRHHEDEQECRDRRRHQPGYGEEHHGSGPGGCEQVADHGTSLPGRAAAYTGPTTRMGV